MGNTLSGVPGLYEELARNEKFKDVEVDGRLGNHNQISFSPFCKRTGAQDTHLAQACVSAASVCTTFARMSAACWCVVFLVHSVTADPLVTACSLASACTGTRTKECALVVASGGLQVSPCSSCESRDVTHKRHPLSPV